MSRLRFRLPLLFLVVALIAIPLAFRTVTIRRHAFAFAELERLAESRDISMDEIYDGQLRLTGEHSAGKLPSRLSKWFGFRGARQVACYGDEIGDQEARLLGDLLHVRTIQLFGTKVTHDGLASLPTSTTSLLLVGPNPDPRLLEGVRHLTQLQRLSVSQISANEVDLGLLADLHSLNHIVLWNSEVTEAQATRLRQRFPQATIEIFNRQDSPS